MDLSLPKTFVPPVAPFGIQSQSKPEKIFSYEWTKRVMDILIAVVILALFLPLWILIGLVIKLTSPGPVLFRNLAIGRNGRPFIYYKFRTMLHNGSDADHRKFLRRFVKKKETCREASEASSALTRASAADEKKPIYKLTQDPRVTLFGRFLRKSSLDEIPQMINVLRGEMSLVGPRPPIWYEYEMYQEWEKQRLAVKPGITGLYQVTARSRVPFHEMVRIDLDYIRRCSLRLDLAIILRTMVVMLTGEGAG